MQGHPHDIPFVQGTYGLDEATYAKVEIMGSRLWSYWRLDDEGVFRMFYSLEKLPLYKDYSSSAARKSALNAIKNYFDKINLEKIAKYELDSATSNLKNAERSSGWKNMSGTNEKKRERKAWSKWLDASHKASLAKDEALRVVNEERNNNLPFNNVGNVPTIVDNVPAFNIPNSQIKRNGGKSSRKNRKSKKARSNTRRN
jgi:hypothetical protein